MKKNQGFNGMSFSQIAMQQAMRASTGIHCRFCGIDVTQPSRKQPETNWADNLEWEKENRAHASCAREDYYKQMEARKS